MNEAGTGKASEDRVAQAMQAIMQLREETEVLARTYGVPDDAPAADLPDEPAVDEASVEVPAEETPVDDAPADESAPAEAAEAAEPEVATAARPRPGTNRYDAALEVIHSEAVAGLRALAGHGFRAGSSFLDLWHRETGHAITQWRSRAAGEVDEAVQGAEQSLESASADLASARTRLSRLGS